MSTDELDAMLRGIASAPALLPAPRVGERLGDRYVIEALLGEGGMGAVYRALDERLGESVALKLVRGADDKLRDEVRLAQKVTHPNVCRTFDLEEADGHRFVKMEYVAGETLATRLRRDGTLPISEVVRIARAIADGLAAAHAKDIVHGDLKPGNIMLAGERVVLVDFGIARHAAASVDRIRGTAGYIAPELVQDRKTDARADYYALGCVVYEMLAGAAARGPDVRTHRTDTPRWLARACTELLATRPELRFAGVARLHAERRFPRRVRVAAISAVVAITGAIGWRLTRHPVPWIANVHDYASFDENGDKISLSPDGEWIAFSSDRRDHGRWKPYVMSRHTEVTTLLGSDDATGLRWSRDGRTMLYTTSTGAGGHVFRRRVAGNPPRFEGAPEDLGPGDSIDDCGDAVLVTMRRVGRWTVELRGATGTREVFSTIGNDIVSSARCDPSGQHVAIVAGPAYQGGGNDVYLADRGGPARRITSDHRCGAVAFAADGRTLIVSRRSGDRLQLFEMSFAGDVVRKLVNDAGPDVCADVSQDGRLLAFMRDSTSFFPMATTATTSEALTHESGIYWFVREVDRDTIVVQRVQSGPPQVVTVKLDGTVAVLAQGTSPFPSRDGATIYFANGHTLLAVPTAGGPVTPVATLPGAIKFGNAGPDGLHVLVQRDRDLAGYRIEGGTAHDEHTDGLVGVAAVGGWRAITHMNGADLTQSAKLELVAPDGQVARSLEVSSIINDWLDDHTVSYCLRDHCEIYDVAAGKVLATLRLSNPPGLIATVARDRTRVFEGVTSGSVSRHIVTNFDLR